MGGAKIHEPSSKLRGRTPLHLAVLGSHIGVIRILAKHGAALSTKLDSSSTALHLAAKNGKAKSIAVLLELGADMMCTNNLGDTPAHSAAAYGYIGCMKAFLDAGFDPNTRGQKGRTIMHTAAIHSIAMLEFLLANNRNCSHIDAQDDEGATPLHLARDREIGMLLLRHGADPEIKDNDGKKCPMRI